MKLSVKSLCIILLSLLSITACNKQSDNQIEEQAMSVPKKELVQASANHEKAKALWQTATIKYFDFEGGFFGLITENGEKLLPMNLPAEFRQNGAVVKISGAIQNDMMTTRQWGTPFNIAEIKLIKAGTIPSKNNNPTF